MNNKQFKKSLSSSSEDQIDSNIFGNDQPQKQTILRTNNKQISQVQQSHSKPIILIRNVTENEKRGFDELSQSSSKCSLNLSNQKPQVYQQINEPKWNHNPLKNEKQRKNDLNLFYFNPQKVKQSRHNNFRNYQNNGYIKNNYYQKGRHNEDYRKRRQGQQQYENLRYDNYHRQYKNDKNYQNNFTQQQKYNHNYRNKNHHYENNYENYNNQRRYEEQKQDYTFGQTEFMQKQQQIHQTYEKKQRPTIKIQKEQHQSSKNKLEKVENKEQELTIEVDKINYSKSLSINNNSLNNAHNNITNSACSDKNNQQKKDDDSDWSVSSQNGQKQESDSQKQVEISQDELSLYLPNIASHDDSGMLSNENLKDQSLLEDVHRITEIFSFEHEKTKQKLRESQKVLRKKNKQQSFEEDNSVMITSLQTEINQQDIKVITQLFKKHDSIPWKVIELKISTHNIQKIKIKKFSLNILGYHNIAVKQIKSNQLIKVVEMQKFIPRDQLNNMINKSNKNQEFKINFIQFKNPLDLLQLKQSHVLSNREQVLLDKLQKIKQNRLKYSQLIQINNIKIICKVCSMKKAVLLDQGSVSINCQQNCKNILKFSIQSVNFIPLQ